MNLDLAYTLWPPRFSTTIERPEYLFADETDVLEAVLSRVVLFNDDHHTFDEVITQVCRATGCSGDHAELIAWEVHTRGQALVYEGELFECIMVSSVLEEIALHTQVLT